MPTLVGATETMGQTFFFCPRTVRGLKSWMLWTNGLVYAEIPIFWRELLWTSLNPASMGSSRKYSNMLAAARRPIASKVSCWLHAWGVCVLMTEFGKATSAKQFLHHQSQLHGPEPRSTKDTRWSEVNPRLVVECLNLKILRISTKNLRYNW